MEYNQPMTTKLVVLGTLEMLGTSHGYEVHRTITSWKAHTWTNIRPGSIYHSLAQCEKEGLLKKKGASKNKKGPTAMRYTLTSQGRRELVHLVEEALVHYEQEEFTAGIAFMRLLPRQRVRTLVRTRLNTLEDIVVFLRKLPTEENASTPDKNPDIIDSWITVFESAAVWTRGFIKRLEA